MNEISCSHFYPDAPCKDFHTILQTHWNKMTRECLHQYTAQTQCLFRRTLVSVCVHTKAEYWLTGVGMKQVNDVYVCGTERRRQRYWIQGKDEKEIQQISHLRRNTLTCWVENVCVTYYFIWCTNFVYIFYKENICITALN